MNFLPRMDRLAQLHRDRVIAVTAALVAAVTLLVMTDLAGAMSWWGLLVTLAAGSVLLGSSDSFSGLVLLAAMVVQWLGSGMDEASWWVVPAAWLLLIAHVAVALAASGPDQAPIPRSVLAIWVPRTVVVGLATTLVAALALLIDPTNSRLVPYGVAAVLFALIVAVLVMIRLTDDRDDEQPGGGEYQSLFKHLNL